MKDSWTRHDPSHIHDPDVPTIYSTCTGKERTLNLERQVKSGEGGLYIVYFCVFEFSLKEDGVLSYGSCSKVSLSFSLFLFDLSFEGRHTLRGSCSQGKNNEEQVFRVQGVSHVCVCMHIMYTMNVANVSIVHVDLSSLQTEGVKCLA